jgi:hypothetical protein
MFSYYCMQQIKVSKYRRKLNESGKNRTERRIIKNLSNESFNQHLNIFEIKRSQN